MVIPNLYFCFPSKEVGGMSMLFMRIAEQLSKAKQAKTFLIDYPDGYMAGNRDERLTELLPYSDNGASVVPDGSVLILQSMTPWSIFPGLSVGGNVKVVFWSCYPFGLIPLLPGLRTTMQAKAKIASVILNTVLYGYKSKMRKFSNLLIESNALIFQDVANLKITQNYLDMHIPNPMFLTIPSIRVTQIKISPQNTIVAKKLLKFSWVGRIVDMKYFTLKHSLIKLNSIQPELGYKVEINIIGQGNYLSCLKKDCLKLKNISILFIDHLSPSELNTFLLHQTDVLLAMGTSALEGAKLGVPTLLLDISFTEIPEGYVYTWLHERRNNDIADILDFNDLKPGNQTLKEKIAQLLLCYEEVSKKELKYFKKNHSLDTISETLLKLCQETTLSWNMLKVGKFLKKGYVYKLFFLLRSLGTH